MTQNSQITTTDSQIEVLRTDPSTALVQVPSKGSHRDAFLVYGNAWDGNAGGLERFAGFHVQRRWRQQAFDNVVVQEPQTDAFRNLKQVLEDAEQALRDARARNQENRKRFKSDPSVQRLRNLREALQAAEKASVSGQETFIASTQEEIDGLEIVVDQLRESYPLYSEEEQRQFEGAVSTARAAVDKALEKFSPSRDPAQLGDLLSRFGLQRAMETRLRAMLLDPGFYFYIPGFRQAGVSERSETSAHVYHNTLYVPFQSLLLRAIQPAYRNLAIQGELEYRNLFVYAPNNEDGKNLSILVVHRALRVAILIPSGLFMELLQSDRAVGARGHVLREMLEAHPHPSHEALYRAYPELRPGAHDAASEAADVVVSHTTDAAASDSGRSGLNGHAAG